VSDNHYDMPQETKYTVIVVVRSGQESYFVSENTQPYFMESPSDVLIELLVDQYAGTNDELTVQIDEPI